MFNKISFVLFFLSIQIVVQAQHTVSGLINDKSDKSVLLQGVAVYIPEFERMDYSKEGGTYILRNVGIGTVTLQFSLRGYKTLIQTINTKDSATVINVELEPHIHFQEGVTSHSQYTKSPSRSTYPNTIFSSAELRRSGYGSFAAALAHVPGMDLFSYGSINKPVIRGMSFNHVALYQAGIPIVHNAWYDLQDYSLSEEGTENIELIKGPASLLYGDNAMGGVLIFTDEKMPPPGTVKGDFNLSFFANTVGFNADAGIKGSDTKGNFYSIRMGGKSHTSYIQGEGELVRKNTEQKDFAYNSGYATGNFKGQFGFSRRWGQSKITVSYLKQQHEVVRSLTEDEILLIDKNEERNRKIFEPFIENSLLAAGVENIILLNKSSLRLNISWQGNAKDDGSKFSSEYVDLKYISDPARKYGFTIGTQGRLHSTGLTSGNQSHYEVTGIGVYALVKRDVDKLNLSAGGRFDSRSVKNHALSTQDDYSIASGSAGLAYHPGDEVTLKLNVSTGFSVPVEQMDNRFIYSYSSIVWPATKLKEERNFEQDFEFSWFNKNVSLVLNAYYNRVKNYIYSRSENGIILFVNTGNLYSFYQDDAFIRGGELSMEVHPDFLKWLKAGTSFSMVRGTFDRQETNIPLIPADKFVSRLTFHTDKMNYLHRPYLSFVLRNYLKQERIYSYILPNDAIENYETMTEGYNLVDVELGGSFRLGNDDFDLSLAVTNIFNTGYYSHLSRLKYLYPVAVKDMGRNISIRLHVPFGIKKPK